MNKLPNEIVLHISKYLDIRSFTNLCSSCKSYFQLVNEYETTEWSDDVYLFFVNKKSAQELDQRLSREDFKSISYQAHYRAFDDIWQRNLSAGVLKVLFTRLSSLKWAWAQHFDYKNYWPMAKWLARCQQDDALDCINFITTGDSFEGAISAVFYADEEYGYKSGNLDLFLMAVEFEDYPVLEMMLKLDDMTINSYYRDYILVREDILGEPTQMTDMCFYSPRPIDIAAALGYADMVHWLVENGASYGLGGKDYENCAIDFAKVYKKQNVIEYLEERERKDKEALNFKERVQYQEEITDFFENDSAPLPDWRLILQFGLEDIEKLAVHPRAVLDDTVLNYLFRNPYSHIPNYSSISFTAEQKRNILKKLLTFTNADQLFFQIDQPELTIERRRWGHGQLGFLSLALSEREPELIKLAVEDERTKPCTYMKNRFYSLYKADQFLDLLMINPNFQPEVALAYFYPDQKALRMIVESERWNPKRVLIEKEEISASDVIDFFLQYFPPAYVLKTVFEMEGESLVLAVIKHPRIDPSLDDNYAIRNIGRIENGEEIAAKLLLDSRVDPTVNDHEAFVRAVETPLIAIALMKDPRVDPLAQNCAVLMTLAADYSLWDEDLDLAQLVLDDDRVQSIPQMVFLETCMNSKSKDDSNLFSLIFNHSKSPDPSSNDNAALYTAMNTVPPCDNQIRDGIIMKLLNDERVLNSLAFDRFTRTLFSKDLSHCSDLLNFLVTAPFFDNSSLDNCLLKVAVMEPSEEAVKKLLEDPVVDPWAISQRAMQNLLDEGYSDLAEIISQAQQRRLH